MIAKKGTAEPVVAQDLLERRIGELEQRVTALERGRSLAVGASGEGSAAAGEESGRVSYSGEIALNGHVVWDIGLTAAAVLQLPNASGSAVLAGLGHPTRAALMRRLLTGPATTTELQQVVANSSTGQLYHHLRTLTGCGLTEQDGRGRYRVPPTAVVPALVLLLAAADIAGDLRRPADAGAADHNVPHDGFAG